MLQLNNAEVTLGQRHFVFSLIAQAGDTLAIVGKSGAGKSTLLNLVAGFLYPTAGDILWNSSSIVPLAPDQRPVTSLFQSGNLFDHLTIEKNVGLGLHPGLALDREQWKMVEAALEQVGLAGTGKRKPQTLSGGEQQRVALARCLARRQPILLLDEPYSALDADTRHQMLALTRQVVSTHNLCALMVSHNPDDAIQLNAKVVSIVADRLSA